MATIELEHGRVDYTDDGEGPPVVLVHGALVDHRLWRDVAPRLVAAGHRVVAPDLPLGSHHTPLRPGADLTPLGLARLVAGLIEALGLDDVTLVGNDTGGAISQLVATRHPERLGRLVLTSCDLEEDFPPKAFQPLVKLAARVPGVLRTVAVTASVPAIARLPLAYGWLWHDPDPALVGSWLAPLRTDPMIRRDTRRAFAGIDPALTVQAAKDLASFDRPALWAWSGADRFFSEKRARRIAATMPDATFTTIPGAYTFSPLDAPEEVTRLVADFARTRRGPAEAGPGTAATPSAV